MRCGVAARSDKKESVCECLCDVRECVYVCRTHFHMLISGGLRSEEHTNIDNDADQTFKQKHEKCY